MNRRGEALRSGRTEIGTLEFADEVRSRYARPPFATAVRANTVHLTAACGDGFGFARDGLFREQNVTEMFLSERYAVRAHFSQPVRLCGARAHACRVETPLDTIVG
jgi:hypothetical protein